MQKKGGLKMVLNEERRERRDTCKYYIRRTGTMYDAKRLAKKERFSANTSVWIGAMSELLMEMKKTDERLPINQDGIKCQPQKKK
jgi:hypothetical protein